MDVGDDSTTSDGGLDQSVQLLVSPDGELEMSGGDSLHLQVLTGVAGQLEDLSREVLQDGGAVHGGGGSNSAAAEGPALQMTMDPRNVFMKQSSSFYTLAFLSYLPTGNCSPALALLDTAFCFDFPVSFPAFPPAMLSYYQTLVFI